MGRCEDCGWCRSEMKCVIGDDGWMHDTDEPTGNLVCDCPKVAPASEFGGPEEDAAWKADDALIVTVSDDFMLRVFVSPRFGCVHWKPKD
jgi:hypothetical protein